MVICIAATNRADVLDPALLRPGRFDRRVAVERPDRTGKRQTLLLGFLVFCWLDIKDVWLCLEAFAFDTR